MNRGTRLLVLLSLLAVVAPLTTASAQASPVRGRYTNQLKPHTASGAPVQNCADPSVLRGRGKYARYWYMYCTSDLQRDGGTSQRLPMLRSRDLTHWRFVGSALPGKPSWATSRSTLWAPDVVYSSTFKRYYLTYTVTDTVDSMSRQPAATRTRPSPWRPARPRPARGGWSALPWSDRSGSDRAARSAPRSTPTCSARASDAAEYLYYGGFRGGINAHRVVVSKYALRLSGAPRQVTIGRRYEGANVVYKAGYYYLFVSSGSCCTGPLSGYGCSPAARRARSGPSWTVRVSR